MEKEPLKYERRRAKMVCQQIEPRGITDPDVLAAMRAVPRHVFVSDALKDQAYGDFPLPIGEQQTISQPFIVAEMTQALQIGKDDRVLEIGTGSGYQAAVLAQIAYRVYTIERIRSLYVQTRKLLDELNYHSLYVQTRKLLDELNYHNVIMRCTDGTMGWKDESPFDAIIVTAGAPSLPESLIAQLAEGGRMVAPVGDQHAQDLIKITKDSNGIQRTSLGGCRFVKLVGKQGWNDA
jgi:protein-L-isoaspartate(D-aspartate) O-methyltransferase